MKQKLLVILGPTATGKSDLAVELALKFNGEIISADSRQVYKGLDVGTGKITQAEMKGVPHHLLDIADPHDRFTVSDWKHQAEAAVADITKRNKLPIICGGTGYYISALVDGLTFPEVEANPEEQKALEENSADELYAILKELDPRRADSMQSNGERTNKRRLARAIIIARELGAVPQLLRALDSLHEVLRIGLALPDLELKERIRTRLIKRLDAGMIEEAQHLHMPKPAGSGLSFERMNELGLEYRYLAEYLQGKLRREQLIETLAAKIWQYARRQKTWFMRDNRIQWFSPNDLSTIEKTAAQFLGIQDI